MRRKEREIRDREEIEAVLRRGQVLHLGLCGEDGWPYVVPLSYGYRDGTIYLHSSQKGKKIEMLLANPKVCFQVDLGAALLEAADADDACGFGMRFTSVIGFGLASVLEDPAEIETGLRALMGQYSEREGWTFSDKVVAKTAVIRIHVESMTGKRCGDPR